MGAVIPFYIKTAYKEEPSFSNTKVVTSLFSNELKNELGENFKDCVEFRDAKKKLLNAYSQTFDFVELGKLAIDYSDAIVQATPIVNAQLLSHAKAKKLPLMAFPGTENYTEAYMNFYKTVFEGA